jgi:D-alanyl-D-alanine carboxypeptidase
MRPGRKTDPTMTLFSRLSLRPLAALALFTGLFASAQAAPVPPAPTLENKAFVVMDFDSGRILAESNADTALPPASMTKMMTSYLVEQALKTGRLKPTDMVQVSEYAWCRGTNTESCMYLPLHGSASVIDMLRGIIIQSGNDASKALAEHLAGNEPAFAAMMNSEAKRLGMNEHELRQRHRPARPQPQSLGPRPGHPGARHHPRQLRVLQPLRRERVHLQRHQARQPQRPALYRPHR